MATTEQHVHSGPVPYQLQSLVDGQPVDGEGASQTRVSPATGQPLFDVRSLSPAQTDDAISRARAAFERGAWSRGTGRERSKVLLRTAQLIDEHAEELATTIVTESGKPIREARGEVATAGNLFEYAAGVARDLSGRTHRDVAADRFSFTVREPAGVAGLVVPWNFPLAILCQKLPQALAAGCTAVVKPSPLTPLSAIALARLLDEAGAPTGTVQVVLGGGDVGARVVAHPAVAVVSFTGSTSTGRRISEAAGQERLKRVAIEAGGKTPVIVLADADVDRAVAGVALHAFFNQGEVCVAGSRVLVEEPVADAFVEGLSRAADALRLGDPFDEGTEMGPLISSAHFDGVTVAVDRARQEGAEVRAGGTVATPDGTAAAPFLSPTVLDRVRPDADVATEELFGPVTAIQRVPDLAAALRIGNTSRYGLAASVWTRGPRPRGGRRPAARRRHGLGQRLDRRLSGATARRPARLGVGTELGREGVEFFTDLKTVQIVRGPGARRPTPANEPTAR